MIRLTRERITRFYGRPIASAGGGRFNADKKSLHSDDAFEYEFGYINGSCCYAIVQKRTGRELSLEEATGLRSLSGQGTWSLNLALTDPGKIQEILDTPTRNLGYIYHPGEDDRFRDQLISVHQLKRRQLVVYHAIWRPDLTQLEQDPL